MTNPNDIGTDWFCKKMMEDQERRNTLHLAFGSAMRPQPTPSPKEHRVSLKSGGER